MGNITLNNNLSKENDSLYIILDQYRKKHITEEEAIKLIRDICTTPIYPYYPINIGQKPYEITCTQ